MPLEIDYVGEGLSDGAVARRLILAADQKPGRFYHRASRGTGKDALDRRLPGLNKGVAYGPPMLVLRDLDQDAVCPGDLVARLLPDRHPRMLLRICVRQAEAWLVADHARYARVCGLPARHLPDRPEEVSDLKGAIAGMADAARKGRLWRHLLDGRTRGVPMFRSMGAWHSEYAANHWDVAAAVRSGRAPSLSRALARLAALA